MTRILLLGAGGQVGRELLPRLGAVGEVVATVRSASGEPALHECLPLDVTDLAALRATLRIVRPAVVVNATGWTAVDLAESQPQAAETLNAVVPGVLAAEARTLRAAVVHYSTDYVFDGRGCRPWREDDLPGPLNVYGRTKLAGEQAIAASGAVHLIVRTSWVYSPWGTNFVRTMLRLGGEREEVHVVDDQIGAPTPASFVAEATVRILTQAAGDVAGFLAGHGGLLHACCGGQTSWHGFAEEIFRLAREHGLPLAVQRVTAVPSRDFPTAARRPLNSRLDCRRLREQFGITPPEWKAALHEAFARQFARGHRGAGG